MENINNKELVTIYHENLLMLKQQLKFLKSSIIKITGEFYWYEKNYPAHTNIIKIRKDKVALERLYLFLIANYCEVRFYEILVNQSSASLTTVEKDEINNKSSITEKWMIIINFIKSKMDISLVSDEMEQDLIDVISNDIYFKEIDKVIKSRNKLAHGQWSVQLNRTHTRIATPEIIENPLNISELILLEKKMNEIINLIEKVISYKNVNDANLKKELYDLIRKIKNYDNRIKKADEFKIVKSAYENFNKTILEKKNK